MYYNIRWPKYHKFTYLILEDTCNVKMSLDAKKAPKIKQGCVCAAGQAIFAPTKKSDDA